MRLFLAIELDEVARAAVVSLQRRLLATLGEGAAALRLVRPEQLHLTLVFLGEVSEDRAQALMDTLDPPLARAPYTLVLGGLGMFPPQGAPRVSWLGVVGGAAETMAVRTAILARLAQAGAGGETGDDGGARGHRPRAFTPHLTVGRWRDSRPGHRDVLSQRDLSWAAAVASMDVNAVTLFHSRLDRAGASHTPIVRTRLGVA